MNIYRNGTGPRYRAPLLRRLRRRLFASEMWAWFYAILFISILLVLEVRR